MIRVKTVTDNKGIERAEVKIRGELGEVFGEFNAVAENLVHCIQTHIREADERTKALTEYALWLARIEKRIMKECELEMELQRDREMDDDAEDAKKEDMEADLAEKIWKSIQPGKE